MKAESLESQLRNAVPPAPDMDARLRARRAALAEFARVHGAQGAAAPALEAANASGDAGDASAPLDGEAGSAGPERNRAPAEPSRKSAGRSRRRESLWPLAWAPKGAWLGGMATACVVVIGVSVVYLMPAKDREIQLAKPLTTATEPTAAEATAAEGTSAEATSVGATAADQASKAAEPESAPPQATTPPIEMKGEAASDAAASQIAPAGPAISAGAGAAGTPGAQGLAQLQASASEKRQTNASSPPRAMEAPMTTDRPAPVGPRREAIAGVRSGQAIGSDNPPLTEEVTVSGSRIQSQAYNSPSAIVSITDESAIAPPSAGRESRGRLDLRSRKASVPTAPPPPAAPADEGRDKFQHFDTNPVKRVADDPVSTFSVDVDTSSYSFVRRQLNQGVLPQPDSVRVEEMINYFDYHWPTSDSPDQPFKPTITVSDSPWGAGKKLIHIGIKGYALPASHQPDVNLVLLLDVSGSMDSPDRLPLAKRSMAMLLDSLRPSDTVAIVVYAGQAGQVLAPTPVSEKETILHALDSLQPGGSTAGAAGIRLAYELAEKSFRKGGVNRILLATDGDFNVGITDQNELKGFVAREREKGVYLSVLGFGQGNYRDEMAQALAQNGNGVAAYIDTVNEAKKVLVQEATSSLFPIAKDVKLQVEFNPATVAEYRLVGYETRALNREDFNNDKVDAGDVGSGHTVTAIYEITPVGSKAKLIDDQRYSQRELRPSSARGGKANEYGYLKIRYKLPNGIVSRLLEQPIRVDAGVPAALRDDVTFSTAVAGFGQLLRGSQYVGSLSYEDVIQQAQRGIGDDRFGYRSELVQLLSKAQRARGL